tara:strand:+ start:268 stop:726 length:459 start_codon:yes stop_codon:yes gene_type:complete
MKKLIFLIFLLTISCVNNKVINNHGPSALDLKSNKIEISRSNKNDILQLLGKPSTESLFNENKWFYIERKKVNQSILKLGKQKIDKNYILEIDFDNYGIVKTKKLYSLKDMNNLKIDKDKTYNDYDKQSYIQKVMSSIRQKIDSPKINRNKN